MNPEISGLIRHALSVVGGYFVAKGYIDANGLTTILAALGIVGSASWSLYAKRPTSLEAGKIAAKVAP